jgi:exopolyphosphatase/guanosine-5'-triphosphate,3'-diphosphate pyrophosphatase
MAEAKSVGFSKVIGTSGSIRALGEAVMHLNGKGIIQSVNAESVRLKDLEEITDRLLDLEAGKRSEVPGISESRVDAIHLGGLLLVELLHLAGVEELTLSDASLREGLIIDYIEKNGQKLQDSVAGKNLRERSSLLLAKRYETDVDQKRQVAKLAVQLFDQLKDLHGMDAPARDLLYHASLIFDVGSFVNFKDYHKHSKYLILNGGLRGFNNAEIYILGHLAKYHRKAGPKKKHKSFRNLAKGDRRMVKGLAGILRIAVALDKTKNQWVENVYCLPQGEILSIRLFGEGSMELELWEAQRFADVLEKFLHLPIQFEIG